MTHKEFLWTSKV